uniref:Orf7 protein n=1 Tax=Rhodococcus sp. CIR2 TaxID=90325 RepID=Q9WXG2_9NOCA|nr:orf7 [Rhodococcus sp. CIR2]
MTTVKPDMYPVSLFDGEDANGVANIVGMLLGQNLENFPTRIKFARKIARPVSIISTDTDSACTIVFGTDEAVVYNDVVGKPAVTVIATVEQIVDVSQLPMKAGGLIPVGFFTHRGMTVLGQILQHKLIVKGLLTHTVTACAPSRWSR